jgi:hypothetical protein
MKKYCKGELITSVEELVNEKSVWVTVWNKPYPVAFIVHMQLALVMRWLKSNYFYKLKKID